MNNNACRSTLKLAKAGLIKIVLRVQTIKIDENDHLIGRKCINGRKLESFGEVYTGPPRQLSHWTRFSKITNKKVIAKNQAKKYTERQKKKSIQVSIFFFLMSPIFHICS